MEIAGITRYIGASAGGRRTLVGLDLPLANAPAGRTAKQVVIDRRMVAGVVVASACDRTRRGMVFERVISSRL